MILVLGPTRMTSCTRDPLRHFCKYCKSGVAATQIFRSAVASGCACRTLTTPMPHTVDRAPFGSIFVVLSRALCRRSGVPYRPMPAIARAAARAASHRRRQRSAFAKALALLLAVFAASTATTVAQHGSFTFIAQPAVMGLNPNLHPGNAAGTRRTLGNGDALNDTQGHPKREFQAGKGSLRGLATVPIVYNGGPVMASHIRIYYIYYGAWADPTGKTLLESFAANLGGSAWWGIEQLYTNGAGAHVSGSVALAGTASVGTPYGTQITDSTVTSIVSSVLNAGTFPVDDNGIYVVLTSSEVMDSTLRMTSRGPLVAALAACTRAYPHHRPRCVYHDVVSLCDVSHVEAADGSG